MSVFDERRDLLDDLEFKHGSVRGRLAASLDILSDAQITIGTHAAYCKQPRDPARPTRDIEEALKHIDHAKELLADVLKTVGKGT
jgi:hypothetical protein